jgi:hypothetical protein
MEVELLSLCDAATSHAGKLNVIGIFDTIMGQQEPIEAPSCSIAARIRFMQLEEGNKTLKIQFIDADGKEVLPTLQTGMDVKVPPTASSTTANFVLGIQQLKLPRFGEYSISLAIDGRIEKSIPLYARRSVPPSPPRSV